ARSPAPLLVPHAHLPDGERVLPCQLEEAQWQLATRASDKRAPFGLQYLGPGAAFDRVLRAPLALLLHAPALFVDPRPLAVGECQRLPLRSPARQRDANAAIVGDANHVAAGPG